MTARPFLRSKELATRWGYTECALRHWRLHGKGPLFHKMGGRVLYYLDEIERFEKAAERQHTTELLHKDRFYPTG